MHERWARVVWSMASMRASHATNPIARCGRISASWGRFMDRTLPIQIWRLQRRRIGCNKMATLLKTVLFPTRDVTTMGCDCPRAVRTLYSCLSTYIYDIWREDDKPWRCHAQDCYSVKRRIGDLSRLLCYPCCVATVFWQALGPFSRPWLTRATKSERRPRSAEMTRTPPAEQLAPKRALPT